MKPRYPKRVLIAGCGDLGVRCAGLFADAQVFGLRRTAGALPEPILAIEADLLTGAGFENLPVAVDTLIYAPTPAARTEAAYRAIYVDALARLLRALPQPAADLRLLYISSTAVYGQNAGEIVDESSPCVPDGFNGRVLLEGESQACACVGDSVAVRLSGLYGPGRHWLLRRVRSGEAIASGEHWTNRVHLDDAAALVACLARLASSPPVVIGTDDRPTTESEVLDWIAAQLNLPAPQRVGPRLVTGKRLCNDLSRSLGWRPGYASYRDGYTSELPGSLAP